MKIYLFLDFKTTGEIFIKNTKYKKEYLLQLTFKLYDSKIEKILEEGDFYVKYSNEVLEEFKENMTVENLIIYSESGLLKKLETPLTTTTIQGIDLCLFNILKKYNNSKIILVSDSFRKSNMNIQSYLETTFKLLNFSILDIKSLEYFFDTIDFDINQYSESKYYSYNNIDKTVRKLNTLKIFFKNLIN